MTHGGSVPLVMNGPLSASAAARDDQRASSIINSPGVDCRNFPSFEAEIAGGFECALKIGELLGVFWPGDGNLVRNPAVSFPLIPQPSPPCLPPSSLVA